MCIIPRSQTPRCASHCRVKKTKNVSKKLRGVHSTMCIIPRRLTLLCHAHCTPWSRNFRTLWSNISRECVTRISTSIFFLDSNRSRPLINRPKYFRVMFRFRRNIRSQSSKISTPRCAWHRRVNFMIDVFTPESISPDCSFKATRN